MSPIYTDTDPQMELLQVRLLQDTPPWRKMEMLAAMNNSARAIAMAGLHHRFPGANQAELRRRLADLLLGPALARKLFGEIEDNA